MDKEKKDGNLWLEEGTKKKKKAEEVKVFSKLEYKHERGKEEGEKAKKKETSE